MFDRTAIHSLGTKLSIGAVLAASLIVAACGSIPTTGGNTSTTGSSALTSCTATIADITESGGSNATAPKYPGASGSLNIDGSSALQPLFSRAAKEFDAANGTTTAATANGSGTGLSDVDKGVVQIGMSDLFQADKNISDLTDHQVAVVAFTLVVSPDLAGKIGNLSTKQIQDVYTGVDSNWSQLGGPNELITVVNRPTSSGTRGTFEKYVLKSTNEVPGNTLTQDNTGAVFTAVLNTPGSIGYVSTGFVTSQTAGAQTPAPICIDGYKPDATDINAGNYQFWNIEHAYTKGSATGAAKDFLTYVESKDFQNDDLPALNFYKVSNISQAAIATHLETGAPTPESFYL